MFTGDWVFSSKSPSGEVTAGPLRTKEHTFQNLAETKVNAPFPFAFSNSKPNGASLIAPHVFTKFYRLVF